MRLLLLVVTIMIASICHAGTNPCYTGNVPPMAIPKQGRSLIMLEARRVQSVQGNIMVYDLGKETILIKADGAVTRLFLNLVQKGECRARQMVTLEPDESSPFTPRFKAGSPTTR
jgi:hypothetical protein